MKKNGIFFFQRIRISHCAILTTTSQRQRTKKKTKNKKKKKPKQNKNRKHAKPRAGDDKRRQNLAQNART
jgi:hypothetical protein